MVSFTFVHNNVRSFSTTFVLSSSFLAFLKGEWVGRAHYTRPQQIFWMFFLGFATDCDRKKLCGLRLP